MIARFLDAFKTWVFMAVFLLTPAYAGAVESAPVRVALVIGNAGYPGNDKLRNPLSDARLTAQSLRQIGFSVTLLTDRTAAQLEQDVQTFAQSAHKADIALFYYAGHGVAVENINYLIPVDWSMASLSSIQLKSRGASLRWIESQLQGTGATVSVMVVDACRNSLQRGSGLRGMAPSHPAKGVLTFFSTAPGARADDGRGSNSLFSEVLNRYLPRTDLSLKQVLEFTQQDVTSESGAMQIPWISSGLVGDIRLGSAEKQAAMATSVVPSTSTIKRGAPLTGSERTAFWNERLAATEEDLLDTVQAFDATRLPLLETRAAAGDVLALTTLGMLYADQGKSGFSIKRASVGWQAEPNEILPKLQPDLKKSARYLKIAADKRFPIAQTLLAELLVEGQGGIQRDYQRAENLLEDAAATGYGRAKADLIDLRSRTGRLQQKDLLDNAETFKRYIERLGQPAR